MADKPRVLFVCIHNAGRSQMAAGYATALSGGAVDVRSGGSEPGDEVNPVAIAAMAEEGIDISQGVPQLMTTEAVRDSDVVITMGCGDVCPIFPGKRYEDFNATTDHIAEYGLAALIGGIAVKKLGLFALAAGFVLKFAKLILIGVAAFGASVMRFFRRKPRNKSADTAAS